jgi:hypothetical protein
VLHIRLFQQYEMQQCYSTKDQTRRKSECLPDEYMTASMEPHKLFDFLFETCGIARLVDGLVVVIGNDRFIVIGGVTRRWWSCWRRRSRVVLLE